MSTEVHIIYRKGERPQSWEVGIYDTEADELVDFPLSGEPRLVATAHAREIALGLARKTGNAVSVHADKPESGVWLGGKGRGETLVTIVCSDGVEYSEPRPRHT